MKSPTKRTTKPLAKSGHWPAYLWREWVRPLLPCLLVVCAFRSAVADWNDVPTGSMKPTILEGDRVLVNKLAFDLKVPFTTWRLATWSAPKRGDIVVFYSPYDGIRLVKRVVGLPGEIIEMRDNRLFVNGTAADYRALETEGTEDISATEEPRHSIATEALGERAHSIMVTPQAASRRSFGPIAVARDHYFVMGDNRDNSFDSRYWGTVSRDRILGAVPMVVMSMNRDHYYAPRWNRFFSYLK